MKSLALLALLLLLCGSASRCAAAPAGESQPIPIVRHAEDGPNPDGSYQWSYETGNGIRAEEEGAVKPGAAPEEEGIASVRGSYSYQADDGTPVEISYTADENGFQARGAAIPQPPEIPPGILRALEWIASHPEEDNL